MATCKDCVHYAVCTFHITENENEKCMHFKNKADFVELVRCKDCKHYTNIDTYRNPPRLDFHWCNKLGNITKENDYCSYGKEATKNE